MTKVLVTGSGGQLGRCIQNISEKHSWIKFTFLEAKVLDITDVQKVHTIFESDNFDFCINCAAYTNVEQAEKTPEKAYAVNSEGVRNMALACKKYGVTLIHISTDYVFDGEKDGPYTVDDIPNPINEYGKSKWEGEKHIQQILDQYFIVRTSWLYSEFGKNFYTTILRKAKTEKIIYVTDEQTGCPTRASNLADFIVNLIVAKNQNFGFHHFTDGVATTWYDFAIEIIRKNGLEGKVSVEKAKNYRTFALRPRNGILSVRNIPDRE